MIYKPMQKPFFLVASLIFCQKCLQCLPSRNCKTWQVSKCVEWQVHCQIQQAFCPSVEVPRRQQTSQQGQHAGSDHVWQKCSSTILVWRLHGWQEVQEVPAVQGSADTRSYIWQRWVHLDSRQVCSSSVCSCTPMQQHPQVTGEEAGVHGVLAQIDVATIIAKPEPLGLQHLNAHWGESLCHPVTLRQCAEGQGQGWVGKVIQALHQGLLQCLLLSPGSVAWGWGQGVWEVKCSLDNASNVSLLAYQANFTLNSFSGYFV